MEINKNTRIHPIYITNICTTTPEIDNIIKILHSILTSDSDINQNTRKDMLHMFQISLEQNHPQLDR
jgi:hypothetical protein